MTKIDGISKWPKSLKYSIPLTKILRPQSTTDLILTFWYFEDVITTTVTRCQPHHHKNEKTFFAKS